MNRKLYYQPIDQGLLLVPASYVLANQLFLVVVPVH
ncbi:unnamed protein product, partial [marine sediment metagenome]